MSPEHASGHRRHDARRRASLAIRLSREPTAPAIARRRVRERFTALVDPQTGDDVLLVVTELVANAVRHGTGEIELRIDFDGERVRGHVVDGGGGFSRTVPRRPAGRDGGYGLHLVGAVATRWGVREHTGHVWFELAVAPAAAG